MIPKFENCLNHPLGILCKCTEYQKVVNDFTFYSIATQHPLLPKVNTEPIASAEVLWINNHVHPTEDVSKPKLLYPRLQTNINAGNNLLWIPISDNTPLKSLELYTRNPFSE